MRASPPDARAPTLFPCELVEGNGDKLRALALEVADGWALGEDFRRWVADECLWINSLVDRIVSQPLEPAGAVAEPYALWAVEKRPGLVMPCRHPSVVLTDDLKPYERLKLFILNLGHTYLAEGWAARGGARSETVRALLADPAILADLNDLYDREVLPVFDAIGMGERGARLSRKRDRALPQPLPRPLSRRHLHQPRGQEAAPFRRPDRPGRAGGPGDRAAAAQRGAGALNALAANRERFQCPARSRRPSSGVFRDRLVFVLCLCPPRRGRGVRGRAVLLGRSASANRAQAGSGRSTWRRCCNPDRCRSSRSATPTAFPSSNTAR